MIVIYFNGTIVNGNGTSIGHGLYLGFLRIICIYIYILHIPMDPAIPSPRVYNSIYKAVPPKF